MTEKPNGVGESKGTDARGIAWFAMMVLVLLTLVGGIAVFYLASRHR